MKGDIGFVGFMLTADEWQELDTQSRAQLIAVATRRAESQGEPQPRRFPEGTGKHEIVESIDDQLDALLELDVLDADLLEPIEEPTNAELEAQLAKLDRDGDLALFTEDAITFDITAQYDVVEQWLAFQPEYEHADLDEWVVLPPAPLYMAPNAGFEDFADWADL